MRKLYERTDEEIGLGYTDLQEFVKDAVRKRLEEVWRVFRDERAQLDGLSERGNKD